MKVKIFLAIFQLYLVVCSGKFAFQSVMRRLSKWCELHTGSELWSSLVPPSLSLIHPLRPSNAKHSSFFGSPPQPLWIQDRPDVAPSPSESVANLFHFFSTVNFLGCKMRQNLAGKADSRPEYLRGGECTMVVEDMGWVDLDFGYSTILPTFPASSAKPPSAWREPGRHWLDKNHSQPNQCPRPTKSPCIISPVTVSLETILSFARSRGCGPWCGQPREKLVTRLTLM